MGKSSLLNAISPELELKTAGISAHLGRGKHTTRHVELIDINGGLVADTPGFSSLEFAGIEAEDLGSAFWKSAKKRRMQVPRVPAYERAELRRQTRRGKR